MQILIYTAVAHVGFPLSLILFLVVNEAIHELKPLTFIIMKVYARMGVNTMC